MNVCLNTKRKLITTNLYMYKNTTVPGVLIECGFITNTNERHLMQTEKYAKVHCKINQNLIGGISLE